MLVGAFEIEVGGPALLGPVAALQREDMGAAAVEPDVEDVDDALVVGGVVGLPRYSCARSSSQASTPLSLIAATIRALTSGSTSCWPVLRSTNNVIGTPQARWRLSTQSGRPSTIDPIRLRPFSGTKRVSPMACIASWRSARALRHRMSMIALSPSSAPPSFSQRFSAASSGDDAARLVHRHEPLRRAAEDDLGLRAPAVRIAVLIIEMAASSAPASRKSEQIGPSGALNLGLMTDIAARRAPSQSQSSRYRPSASTANTGSMPFALHSSNHPRHGRATYGPGRCRCRW